MEIKHYLAISVSAIALQTGALQAQDFYGGIMIGVSDGKHVVSSGIGAGLSRNTNWQTASALAGVRFQSSTPLFYGIELETSLGLNGNSDVNIFDQSRLRAVIGYNFDKFSAFAAIGAVRQGGSDPVGLFASDWNAKGTTFGLGVEVPMSDKVNLRGEVLYDDASSTGYLARDFTSTTIRLGAIIKF